FERERFAEFRQRAAAVLAVVAVGQRALALAVEIPERVGAIDPLQVADHRFVVGIHGARHGRHPMRAAQGGHVVAGPGQRGVAQGDHRLQRALQAVAHPGVVRRLLRQRQVQRDRRVAVARQVAGLQRLFGLRAGLVDAVRGHVHLRRAPGQGFGDRVVPADGDHALARLRVGAGLAFARGFARVARSTREQQRDDDRQASCAQTMLRARGAARLRHRPCRWHARATPRICRCRPATVTLPAPPFDFDAVPHWITDPAELDDRLARRPRRIGLDTEFIRERTYWPQLALVQVAIGEGDDDILLVDPLCPGITDALRPVLTDAAVLKVMHSPSEDLVAFMRACGAVPQPLFDTQAAAALSGIAAGVGYQRLVQETLQAALPKGETRSDWLRRPLSPSQLEYAADDVRHLFALHDALDARLLGLGREGWLQEDGARVVANAERDDGDRWPHLSLRAAQFLDEPARRR